MQRPWGGGLLGPLRDPVCLESVCRQEMVSEGWKQMAQSLVGCGKDFGFLLSELGDIRSFEERSDAMSLVSDKDYSDHCVENTTLGD